MKCERCNAILSYEEKERIIETSIKNVSPVELICNNCNNYKREKK